MAKAVFGISRSSSLIFETNRTCSLLSAGRSERSMSVSAIGITSRQLDFAEKDSLFERRRNAEASTAVHTCPHGRTICHIRAHTAVLSAFGDFRAAFLIL